MLIPILQFSDFRALLWAKLWHNGTLNREFMHQIRRFRHSPANVVVLPEGLVR